MDTRHKSHTSLMEENARLRQRIAELEEERASWYQHSPPEVLHSSDGTLHALLKAMSDVILVIDAQGQYLDVPETSAPLTYRPTSDIIGKNVCDTMPSLQANALIEHIGHALATRQTVNIDYYFSLNSSDTWFSLAISPLTHDSVLCVARDITGHKRINQDLERQVGEQMVSLQQTTERLLSELHRREQIEQELLRRDAILEAVGAVADQFLRMSDMRYNIQSLLEQLGVATGVSRVYVFENKQDFNGRLTMNHQYEWLADGIASRLDDPSWQNQSYQSVGLERWQRLLSQGESISGRVDEFPEHEQQTLRQHHINALVAVPIFVGQSWWGFIGLDECSQSHGWSLPEIEAIRVAASIIGAALQRFHAQASLHKLENELQKLYRAVENSPICIMITDVNGVIEYVNYRFTQVTGYSFIEALGQKPGILKSGRTSPETYSQMWETILQGKEWRGEIQNRKKDGTIYWDRLSISSIKTPHGTITNFVAFQEDITERKQAERELQEAWQTAETATRAKSAFLATMSHEIRTPMNAVIGMTNLLLETRLTPNQQDYVETIRISGDALLYLIDEILDFSKIEAGKLELEYHPFDLRNCIEEAMDLVTTQAEKKDLDLAYFVNETTPPLLIGDVSRLRQILTNILSNAVKFTERGGIVVSVTGYEVETMTDPRLTNYEIHFSVEDTGIGIPEEAIPNLFQSFQQVNSSTSRKYGGTGLGLAISKRIAEMMGGTMWVESAEGKGSLFHFTIVAEAALTSMSPGFDYLSSDQPFLVGKRVLVVDDQPRNRLALSRYLRNWQIQQQTTDSLEEAVAWLQTEEPFDATIINVHALDDDEMSLFTILQQYFATMPLLLLTTVSLWDKTNDVMEFQKRAILTRPIKPLHLYEALIDIFAQKNVRIRKPSPQTQIDPYIGERHPLRILVAEDNISNQKVIQLLLENMHYRADLASNGHEVLVALERQPYDLVFMDVEMPDMDGIEATHCIRKMESLAAQPWIIAMTAHAMKGDRERFLSLGMDDYVSKPVRVNELARVLLSVARATNSSYRQTIKVAGGAILPLALEADNDSPSIPYTSEEPAAYLEVPENPGKDEPEPEPVASLDDPSLNMVAFNQFITLIEKGGPQVASEIIDSFLSDLLLRFTGMQEAVQQENPHALYVSAHSLKSLSAQLGADSLSKHSLELEQMGKAGSLEGAGDLMSRVEEEYETIKSLLKRKKARPIS